MNNQQYVKLFVYWNGLEQTPSTYLFPEDSKINSAGSITIFPHVLQFTYNNRSYQCVGIPYYIERS